METDSSMKQNKEQKNGTMHLQSMEFWKQWQEHTLVKGDSSQEMVLPKKEHTYIEE